MNGVDVDERHCARTKARSRRKREIIDASVSCLENSRKCNLNSARELLRMPSRLLPIRFRESNSFRFGAVFSHRSLERVALLRRNGCTQRSSRRYKTRAHRFQFTISSELSFRFASVALSPSINGGVHRAIAHPVLVRSFSPLSRLSQRQRLLLSLASMRPRFLSSFSLF